MRIELDKQTLRKGLRRVLSILTAVWATVLEPHRSNGQKLRCRGINGEDLKEFLDNVGIEEGLNSMEEL